MTDPRDAMKAAVEALEGVIRVADRKTDEFDAARSALSLLRAALEAREPQPLTDEQALGIHSMPYVRDCLARYALCADDEAANEVVRSIVNAANGLMVGAASPVAAPVEARDASKAERCRLLDELIWAWFEGGNSLEQMKRRMQARANIEAAWPVASPAAATQGDAQDAAIPFDRAAVFTIWQGMQYQGGITTEAQAVQFAQQVLAVHGVTAPPAGMKEQPSDGVEVPRG